MDWQDTANFMVLAVVCLLLVGVAVLLISVLRQRRRQAELISSVRSDLRALCNAAVTVGERVNRLERHVHEVSRRQDELGLRQNEMAQWEPEGQPFDQAIKLAHRGASVEELMEVCGLPRGEAELIAMMHRLEHAG